MADATRLPIGVTLGNVGVDAGWWLDSARRLDEAGYRAIWAWDHFVSKGRDKTTPVLESWTLLSAGGALTRHAFLGPFVLNVTNRHPAVLARMAGTLQAVAGGRLRIGIGIGGHEDEHRAYGIDFPAAPERVRQLEDAVGVMRRLWSGGPADFDGHRARLRDAWAHPMPDPAPPILIGAQSRTGIGLAARLGDGWAAEAASLDELMPRYLEALDAEGRDRREQLVVVGFPGGRSGAGALAGSPFVDRPREALAGWLARGADEVALTARTQADVDALVDAAERW